MRLIVVSALVALSSTVALQVTASPLKPLANNIGIHEKNTASIIRLMEAQVKSVQLQRQKHADVSSIGLEKMIYQLKTTLNSVLSKLAIVLQLTSDQVAQTKTDIAILTDDLKTTQLEPLNVDGTLEKVARDIYNILRDFGAPVRQYEDSEVTTPKTALDLLLEELEEYMLVFLPLLAPELGLTFFQVFKIEKYFHSFVQHMEAMEHGTMSLIDGSLYVTIDLLNIAEVFDVDVTLPTLETPTSFDEMLAILEKLIDLMFEITGKQDGVPEEKIEKIEADINSMIKDFEAIEHGEISILNGIEAFLQDLINCFQNFEDEPSMMGAIMA